MQKVKTACQLRNAIRDVSQEAAGIRFSKPQDTEGVPKARKLLRSSTEESSQDGPEKLDN